ncbi:MAG: fibronectin type III domain-containing protein [Salinivirgaceae bacterium]
MKNYIFYKFQKKGLVYLFLFFLATKAYPQPSTANYTFTVASNGTLTNMVSGTTQLINPDVDGLNTGTFSVANDIGFAFCFMGMQYTQFVATEDGIIRLGNSLSPINRVPELDVSEPRLVAFSCDMRTGNNGKVHYKTTGSAPNRVFTIEWYNMIIAYSDGSQTGKSTFQIRLYETSNLIEYIYGYMYADVHRGGQEDYGAIGFSNSNVTNGIIYKTGTFTNNSVLRTSPATTILPGLVTAVGEISGLSSTSAGHRRIYRFTPIAPPNAPTNITFTSITYSSITVGWTDNSSNESYFLVYRSEDGGITYELVSTDNAGVTSSIVSGLPSKSYTFKIVAINEGGVSSALIGSTATVAAGEKVSNVVSGNWNTAATWLPSGVPAATDNVTILDGHTITIDATSAVCNNLTVGQGSTGTLNFIGGTTSATLTTDGDVTVAAGGTFDIVAGATSGTRLLVIGNRTRANSNLTVNGTFDMDNGGSSVANVEFRGSSSGTISGAGATCHFYSITLNKGTNNTPILEATRVITVTSPTSTGNSLTLSNGTFKLSSASSLAPYFGSNTIVAATAKLWLNHASASVQCVNTGISATGAGDATIASGGILTITSGTFGYGAGSNTLTINGTVQLESATATLNQFGRLYLPNSGYLIMSDGNINLDPRAVADLANNTLEFDVNASVLLTGGRVTLVDPLNNTSYYDFLIPSAGESNKNFMGSTLRCGDGSSSTAGSTNGFVISSPTQYALSLGNIEVNNPGTPTNRFVWLRKTDSHANNSMIQGLTITAGSFRLYNTSSAAYTVSAFRNIVNNGTLDASITGNRIQFAGSSAQTYSGSGSISATNNLEIQLNNSAGVTLSSPLTAYTLVLTKGKLTTTATNILTLQANTTTGSGTATSFVNGPLKRILPTGTNTITFPVGKGSYNMVELVNAITTSNTMEVIAEVMDADCGGTYTNPPYLLNKNRYWSMEVAANSANFTNSYVRVTEVGTTTGQYSTRSITTSNGVYTNFSDGVGGGYTLSSNGTITNTPTINYFSIASNYMEGNYNVGSAQAYTSITGASGGFFAAVNSTGLRGNVTANITSDITETGEISLNQWNEANGSGYTLTIQSSAAATRTLSGSVNNVAAGGPGAMIRVNGADNVVFDGTTSRYLVFKNNTTNAGNTSPTFEIYNGSTAFTLSGCNIENHNNSTSTQGTITIGSGTNSNLTISGNQILNATTGYAGYPYCAIYCDNASNSSVTISGNYIYNFGNYGCYLVNAGDEFNLLNNHLYKTLTDDLSAINQTGIYLNGGNGHTIEGNYIGGQAISCGGSAWTNNGSSSEVKGVVLNVGTDIASEVQNNTISNFNVQSTSGTVFTGFEIIDGAVNLGTSTGNTVSNITTLATAVNAIYSSTHSCIVIANNTINTINANGTGASTVLKGIVHSGSASANINNNAISALSCAGASTGLINQTVSGIYLSVACNSSEIHDNTIYNLTASNTGAIQTNASAIAVDAAVSINIFNNKIYDIKNSSTMADADTPPTASGIMMDSPETGFEIFNNLISLGNSQTTNTSFYGIWMNEQPSGDVVSSIYYNSILIDGSASSGAMPTFALLRGNNGASTLTKFVMDCKNNIFANRRAGGTGKHYSIGNKGSNPTGGWGANATDYNLLVTGDPANLGLWNLTDYNFANWKTNTHCDINSSYWVSTSGTSDANNLNLTNLFTSIASGDLSIVVANPECWAINGNGMPLASINSDFTGTARSSLLANGASDIGTYEIVPVAVPIAAIQTGTIADGNTTIYSLAGRTLAQIAWHGPSSPSFPTVALRYFSGTNATDDSENTLASTQYSNSFWRITATGGDISTYNYDLTLYYSDNILKDIADESAANIIKNPVYYPTHTDVQNVWRTYNATANDAVNNYITVSGVIGFSDFALELGMFPLPITLAKFEAIANQGTVVLLWETLREINNDFFTIEKTANLSQWSKVATVQGAGNSSQRINYSYTDQNPFQGTSYYRLKQTDFNGDFTYSDVKSVTLKPFNNSLFTIYYRSESNELVIENLTNAPVDAKLSVFNANPAIALQSDSKIAEGITTIPLGELTQGFYFASMQSVFGTVSFKFVVN